jgi:hypothetical protein
MLDNKLIQNRGALPQVVLKNLTYRTSIAVDFRHLDNTHYTAK